MRIAAALDVLPAPFLTLAEMSTSSVNLTPFQARREGGLGGVSYSGLRDVWGLAVAQKYKIHQNAPF